MAGLPRHEPTRCGARLGLLRQLVPASYSRRLCGSAAAARARTGRSLKRRLAPSIPILRRASTTSPTCFKRRATLRERALAICEKTLGPEHPHTATNLNNLALLLRKLGDYAGARP